MSASSIDAMSSADITLLNQTESPLLRLPGEIRNQIYKHFFAGCYLIADHFDGGKLYVLPKSGGDVTCTELLALGQTSRQLRFETASKPLRLDKVRADRLAEDIGGMSLKVRRTVTHLYLHEMVQNLAKWRMLGLLPKLAIVVVVAPFVAVSAAKLAAIRQMVCRVSGNKLRIGIMNGM